VNFYQPSWAKRRRVLITERSKLNYSNFIDRLADLYGDRTAFMLDGPIDYPGFSGDCLSFRDVARVVNRMAGALRALGVGPGDRVGLITMNRVEIAFANFAAAKLGAIPVPMNFMLRPNEIDFIVQKAGIELLVCDPRILRGTIKDLSSVPSVKHWAVIGNEEPPEGVTLLADLMRDAPDYVESAKPSSLDDIALLFFTSGTTGFPKGATMSHAAAMVGIHNIGRLAALSPKLKSRFALLVMPVAHAGGYAQMLLYLGFGTPAYFLSKFDPEVIFDVVERLRPTLFPGAPAMYRILLDAGAAKRDWSSVRVFGGGADAFDDDLVRAVRALGGRRVLGFHVKPMFIRGYGMAESNSYVTATPPFEAGDNCLGWVTPPVRYRIVDEDTRKDVERGKPGELLLRGPNITRGYWNDDFATELAFENGWFRTGDIVRQGKWRMLFFVGRSAEIIKSGGYKISANEVDQHLTQHPDVEHAATVGVPHPIKGERPVAAVKLRPGATTTPEELLEWARERIAPYKCPREIVLMDDMPFTFSLKPKRREVRERLLAEMKEDLE